MLKLNLVVTGKRQPFYLNMEKVTIPSPSLIVSAANHFFEHLLAGLFQSSKKNLSSMAGLVSGTRKLFGIMCVVSKMGKP
jgi:hypothetical protein